MRPCALVLVALIVTPAAAQSGPSFDCAKASSEVELAICAMPQLAAADREMAAIYTALVG